MATSSTGSFDELFANASWARPLALRLVSEAAAADDLVQDGFLAALERAPRRVTADGATLEPWLRSVLRRRAAFLARGRRRRADREADVAAGAKPADASDDVVSRAEGHRVLANAVMELRDPYRSVILLRYFDDLSPREIAQRLGVPPGTVRSQLKRGLDELRAELDRGGDRRTWCVALIPLAVDETASGLGPVLSLLPAAFAMHVLVKIAVPVAAVLTGWALLRPTEADVASPRSDELLAASPTAAMEPVEEEAPAAQPLSSEERAREAVPTERVPAPERSESGVTRGVFAGSIVSTDGELVPDFAFELHHGEARIARIASDELGRFTSETEFVAGDYVAMLFDRDGVSLEWHMRAFGNIVRRERESVALTFAPGEELELVVPVGPTYPLVLEGTAEALGSELHAWISGPDTYSGREGSLGFETRTPVRFDGHPSGRPWVRFQPAEPRLATNEGLWKLAVESADGRFRGEVRVPTGDRVHDAVTVELEPCAVVVLDVRASDGGPLQNPEARLLQDGWASPRELERIDDGAASSLTFRLGWLPPGAYRLDVFADDANSERLDLALEAGETFEHDVVLESRRCDAAVRGELVSETGTYRGEATLFLRASFDQLSRSVSAEEWVERDGEWVFPFAFEDLPPGRYDLDVLNWGDGRTWQGTGTLEAPAGDVRLTCLDAMRLLDLELSVRVAPGTAEPDRVQFHYVSGGFTTSQPVRFGEPLTVDGHPEESSFEWSVRADGFVPVWGDLADFAHGPTLSELTVELVPGWGERFVVESADGPIAGASVYVDGALAGTADAEGTFELRRSERPSTIEFRAPGREPRSVDLERRADFPFVTVRLDPSAGR